MAKPVSSHPIGMIVQTKKRGKGRIVSIHRTNPMLRGVLFASHPKMILVYFIGDLDEVPEPVVVPRRRLFSMFRKKKG